MNFQKRLIILLLFTLSLKATLYENAENGNTINWLTYDNTPLGAIITNVYEDENHFIKLLGTDTKNGFILGNFENKNGAWENNTEKLISWKMKTSSQFFIFIRVNTSNGNKYIYYDTNPIDSINRSGYIHHQLDSNASNGTWQTFTRNLSLDLDPSNNTTINEVNAFLVRASDISFDDITLALAPIIDVQAPIISLNGSSYISIVVDSNYNEEGAKAFDDFDGNITQNINILGEVNSSIIGTSIITYNILDSSGNYAEINRTVATIESTNTTSYENSEDGLTSRWEIYDNSPAGASIHNILDNQNHVIQLQGTNTQNGFILGNFEEKIGAWDNTNQTLLSWKMKTSTPFYIFVRVSTTDGAKYIYYDENPSDSINNSNYIHHFLGNTVSNGNWQTINRNLAQDLDLNGEHTIIAVNAFLVRSSNILIDDVQLSSSSNIQDLTAPIITLNGENPQVITVNSNYVEEGAMALDNIQGDLSTSITSTGSVNSSQLGSYTIIYNVSDASGNSAESTRIVHVVNAPIGINYSNSEEGNTTGWSIYDRTPSGASITENTQSIIRLEGTSTQNGFILGSLENKIGAWNNKNAQEISWKMKTSSSFFIFLRVQTSKGHKYLYYDENPNDTINRTNYIHHQLGENISNGTWQTFNRNLANDLKQNEDEQILAINAFLVRSEDISIADVTVKGTALGDKINPIIELYGENIIDIIVNNEYLEVGFNAQDNLEGNISSRVSISGLIDTSTIGSYVLTYSVYDLAGNYSDINRTINIIAASTNKVYEDAEDGSTSKWKIYDTSPAGARVENIIENTNRVIRLQGTNTQNGFILGDLENTEDAWDNTQGTILSWKMKTNTAFYIFVRLSTSQGYKYLYYSENPNDVINNSEYIYHQLEGDISDGTWNTISRDLAIDLDPTGVTKIIAVNALLIRASDLFIDDILLQEKSPELLPPILKLNGANPLFLVHNIPYIEKSATAIDNFDGNITSNIIITGEVNTSLLGNYIINYSIIDSDNNIAELNRTIQIVTAPQIDTSITLLLEESAKNLRNDLHYLVVGDSTRQHVLNDNLTYYEDQLNKINVNFLHTARSGLKAKFWLDGTSSRVTISDTLALIPQENQANYILEFSLGINDFGIGGNRNTVYQTIKDSLSTLKSSRPNMKIILVSPVAHNYPGIPNTSNNLESIYLQIASEENLTLISAKKALSFVQGNYQAPDTFNSNFYLDQIHPNSDALKRLINYIFSELGSTSVHSTMTVTGSDTKTLSEIQINLPINLTEE